MEVEKVARKVTVPKKVETIGVLTSGGDAPGMNAAIRAVVRTALANGLKVKGIRRGYSGLLEEDIFDMDAKSVSDIIQRGGTALLNQCVRLILQFFCSFLLNLACCFFHNETSLIFP